MVEGLATMSIMYLQSMGVYRLDLPREVSEEFDYRILKEFVEDFLA